MTDEPVNQSRRCLLIGASSVVGAVGVVGAVLPFVQSWAPNAKARAAGAPVEVDISKLELGQRMVVEWRGRPVWIVRRTKEALAQLSKLNDQLRDPASNEEQQQPKYAKNEYRSIKPEYLVLVGICTHLGCSPTYRPDVAATDLGSDWPGGFFCPCHGSRFDFAGRVFKGVPAPINLEVPPHHYVNDKVLIIGEDKGVV